MHVHRPFRATGFLALFLASLGITSSRAQEGACCKPDESCVVIPPGQCQVLGGYYLGDGTTCDPDPCGIPFGACCFPGYCIMTLEPDCNDQSGLFMGDGTRCDFNPCPPPTGACCTAGVCDVRTQDQCFGSDQYYLGDYTVCEPTSCDPPHGCGGPTPRGGRADVIETLIGHGVVTGRGGGDCGTLQFTADGSYENGIAWDYLGVRAPYFGGFAECYTGEGAVCAAVFDFTQIGAQSDATLDVYLWDDEGGCPGNVICVKQDVLPGPIAFWPQVSRHEVPLAGCCVPSTWWIGYWPNWPNQGIAQWFIGLDLDGPTAGCAKTCAVPGIGYPSGWQDVATIWHSPCQSLGIGARVTPCMPVAVERGTWGRVKLLYR